MRKAALLLPLLMSCAGAPEGPGLFVLGIDGMDPVILQRMMDEGRMPHFAALKAQGGFQKLGTATPPQSPVAWSNFVTGMNPGGHGIYDFVHRDPRTYLPISSATPPVEPGDAVEIGGYYFPIGGESPSNNRGGTPFWDYLDQAGVDVEVYRVPGNYPPPPSEAKVLSGMGTVDMRGGYGVYSWFTDLPMPNADELKGDIQLVTVSDDDLDGKPETVRGALKGAPDIFRLPPGKIPGDTDYLTAPVTFTLDAEQDVVLIEAGDDRAVLRPGEWSDWMTLRFDALPWGLMPMDGIVRFYVRSLRPSFEVYASPVNISPAVPAQPLSTPDDFATELYDLVGHYYTQGMPEETNALKDRVFNDDEYQKQVGLIQQDAGELLWKALARFQPGDFTFFYLSDIDLQCHMLWRLGDPKHADAPQHPAFEADAAVDHADDIEGYYEHVDGLLGRIQANLPAETTLIVMSDHGFQPQTREVHLNTWLRDHGWLALKDDKKTGQIALGDVDWSKTRAYGLGFNAVYLNLAGREAEGIVQPTEAEAALAELSTQLLAFKDPKNGASVIRRVDRASAVYSGARVSEAPDLVVGYDAGYGASDQSTLGEIVDRVLDDNTSRWSGNHLMAPEVVPGVVLSNRPLAADGYDLTDITATVLAHYGLAVPANMEGENLFQTR